MRLRPLALVALLLATTGCYEDLSVRWRTTVYEDGGIARVLEVRDTTPDDEKDDLGVLLAAPDAWDRVREDRSVLRAEGIFAPGQAVPPLFAFVDDEERVEARAETTLRVEDRVVATRYVFAEIHGDPYDRAAAAAALDAMLDELADAIVEELRRHYGRQVDLDVARRTTRRSILAPMADRLLDAARDTSEDVDTDWNALIDDAAETLAGALSRGDDIIAADGLPLPRDLEELTEWVMTTGARRFGGDEAFEAWLLDHLRELEGFYGSTGAFNAWLESRLELPGRVLRTNGTTDGESIVWSFSSHDLIEADVELLAESIVLNVEALTALGARRKFDTAELVRLSRVLFDNDPEGERVPGLRDAVARGDLELLEDDEDGLARLLDAATPRLPEL